MFDESDLVSTEVDDITISAGSTLVEKNVAKKEFLWGYYFCIENNSKHKISLVGKNWHITDDRGNNYSDETAGFKGEIPDLEPGEFYGSCKIKATNDVVKDIKIPTFQMSTNEPMLMVAN